MGSLFSRSTAPTPERSRYYADPRRTDKEILLDRLSALVLKSGGDCGSAFYCQQLGVDRTDIDDLFCAAIKRNEMLIDKEHRIQAAILSDWEKRRERLLTCAYGDDVALLDLIMKHEKDC